MVVHTYSCIFIHAFPGDHEIRVQMAGEEVPRSPFRVRVADPKQVVVDCPAYASLGSNAHVKGELASSSQQATAVIL